MNPVSLVFVIGSACGAISAFIALTCSNMRASRCRTIKCCLCIECQRENLTEKEYEMELENQHEIQAQAQPQKKQSIELENRI